MRFTKMNDWKKKTCASASLAKGEKEFGIGFSEKKSKTVFVFLRFALIV